MNPPPDRLREHPEQRFQSSQHPFDLDEVAQKLRAEPLPASRRHRQETLYKGSSISNGPTTIALFVFEAGGHLPQHVAHGVVTIHAIEGHLRIAAEGREHHLKADQILVLAPDVAHDVHAEQPSRMLLTVCLEKPAGD